MQLLVLFHASALWENSICIDSDKHFELILVYFDFEINISNYSMSELAWL